ncbi:unnamed protein product [Ascophyllum nodosum]
MKLSKSKQYLQDVLGYKLAVPFIMFTGGVGRHPQGKLPIAKEYMGEPSNKTVSGNKHKHTFVSPGSKCGWPRKATRVVLDLVRNAESNAESKGLDVDSLYIVHVQANRAPKQRRRTYRAHGRINPYMSSLAHIELILWEKEVQVKKAEAPHKPTRKESAIARRFLKFRGGVEV